MAENESEAVSDASKQNEDLDDFRGLLQNMETQLGLFTRSDRIADSIGGTIVVVARVVAVGFYLTG